MKNKCLSILIASFLLLIMVSPCLYLFSYAYTAGVVYSQLPEPENNDYVKAFVLAPSLDAYNNNSSPLLYVFYNMSYTHEDNIKFVVHFYLNSNGYWEWLVDFYDTNNNNVPYPGSFFFGIYNAINGNVYSSRIYSGVTSTTVTTSYSLSTMPYYQSYGCDYVNGYSGNGANLASIYWSFAQTNSFFTYLLNTSLVNIISKLNSIDMELDRLNTNYDVQSDIINDYLDNYDSWLDQIESHLSTIQLQDLDNWYNYMLQVTAIQSYIDDIEMNQSSILNEIRSQCTLIQSKIDRTNTLLYDLYVLLGGTASQTTRPAESTLHNKVNEHNSQEDRYMQDFDSEMTNLNQKFNDVSSQFTNFSSTFLFVRNVFESFISNYSYTYIVLIFSLTFGLLITIIGKRIGG